MKLVSITLALLSLTAGYALEGWQTDMDAARKQAVEQKKDLMIVYQGKEWKPGQPGRPESMLESPLFRDKVKDRFILVEQKVKEGDDVPEKMVLLLTDSQGSPFFAMGGSSSNFPLNWWLKETSLSRKNREAILPVVKAVEKAKPGDRKQEIEKVKKLFPQVCFSVPPASEWSKESPFEETSTEEMKKKLSNFFKGNIKDPALIHWRKVIMLPFGQMTKLGKEAKWTEAREQEEWKLFEEKLGKLIAESPGAKSSRFANIVVRETLRGSIITSRIGELKKTDPATACKELLKQEQLPGMSVETRQLWALMRASCLLKQGETDQGLRLIDQQVKEVPWTKNAESWSSLAERVRSNRNHIDELHQKELKGDHDAAKERDALLGVDMTLGFGFSFDMVE